MLKDVLSSEDCAKCRFCCSFRRQSLGLTPCFAKETVDEIRSLYPDARFKTRLDGAVTIDIDDRYRTDDSEEEALCPFNQKGCVLQDRLKPFDCKLWPFRLMKCEDGLALALVPTCPWIKKDDADKLNATASNVAKEAVAYANAHPEIVIEYRPDYEVVCPIRQS